MAYVLGLHNAAALDEIMAADEDLGREILAELAALNGGIIRQGNVAREVDQHGYTMNCWFDDVDGSVRGPDGDGSEPALFDLCEMLRDPPEPIDGWQDHEADDEWQARRFWQSRRHGR